MRVGLRIPACSDAATVAGAVVRAERLGYDAVWIPDSQLLWRDVWVVAALASRLTDRINIGTAVTNFRTRHVTVLASAARTVQECADGRFIVGVGAGNSSLAMLGLEPTPGAQLRANIRTLRALLAGDEVDVGAGTARLRDADAPCRIFMAASGPHNLRHAGSSADGVITLTGVSGPLLRRSLDLVRQGIDSAGRQAQDVAVVVSAFAHVTDDVERDARILKPLCAALANTGGGAALRAAGVHVAPVPERLPDVYPDLVHAEDWELAIGAVDEFVSDEAAARFAREFCLFGSAREIEAKLAALAGSGVTEVLVQHVGSYELPEQLMEAFADVAFN